MEKEEEDKERNKERHTKKQGRESREKGRTVSVSVAILVLDPHSIISSRISYLTKHPRNVELKE